MIKPVIMGFRRYARIAPRLPPVAVGGQASFSGGRDGCDGGHATMASATASRAEITGGLRTGHDPAPLVNARTRSHLHDFSP